MAGISAIIFWPLAMAITAGLLMVVFSMLMGGNATFKHVFAIVAHSAVIIAIQQAFSMPLSYARGEFAGANLGIFVPMLEETSFPAKLLGSIDLFFIWWMVSLAIGIGVLYKRKTGGIATSLLFFASILLHELAHSFVALAKHIPVRSITLFIFGGVAQIGREPDRPQGFENLERLPQRFEVMRADVRVLKDFIERHGGG